jgi:lipoyl(octanoyl) transferase
MSILPESADILMLGRINYSQAMAIQDRHWNRVREGKSAGAVLLLENDPPVITLGRRATSKALCVSEENIKKAGFAIHHSSRGGFATVHEPGQAVVYFVLPVEAKSTGFFVSHILHLAADFLAKSYGIIAQHDAHRPGLWWNGEKLCACGFDLTGGVSRHGIAINVSNSLAGFSLIIPCGMRGIEATSVSRILHRTIECGSFLNEFAAYLNNKQRELC